MPCDAGVAIDICGRGETDLPDCRIEQSDWSLTVPWNSWLVVEKLAENDVWLQELTEEFLSTERQRVLLDISRTSWVEYIDLWLKDHGLA